MAMYSPIRDAFADMNKLMIDSMQWDEKRAAANDDREFKQTMLMSQLEQRRFNNDMGMKEFALRERGEQRLADNSQFQRFEANRQWEMDTKKAGQDTEFHKARMEKATMEREQMQHDLDQENEFLNEKDAWLQESTEQIFQDPVDKAVGETEAIATEIADMQKRLGTLDPKNNRNTVMRGIVNQRINEAAGRLESTATPIATPGDRVDLWRDSADKARELAQKWYSFDRKDEGDGLMKTADAYDKRADNTMVNALKDQKNAAAKLAKDQWDKRFDRFAKFYGEMDANNQIFLGPGAKARVQIAQIVAQDAANNSKGATDGQLFLVGMNAVDKLEAKLENDVARIRANEEGLLSPQEVMEQVANRMKDYESKYDYVPEDLLSSTGE